MELPDMGITIVKPQSACRQVLAVLHIWGITVGLVLAVLGAWPGCGAGNVKLAIPREDLARFKYVYLRPVRVGSSARQRQGVESVVRGGLAADRQIEIINRDELFTLRPEERSNVLTCDILLRYKGVTKAVILEFSDWQDAIVAVAAGSTFTGEILNPMNYKGYLDSANGAVTNFLNTYHAARGITDGNAGAGQPDKDDDLFFAETVPETRVIIIGAGTFRDARIAPAASAAADAEALAAWCTASDGGGFSPAHITLLVDDSATADAVRRALFIDTAGLRAQDRLIIFYSGRGTGYAAAGQTNAWLLVHDTDPDRLAATALPVWHLEQMIRRYAGTGNVVILADTGREGSPGLKADGSLAAAADNPRFNPAPEAVQSLGAIRGVCAVSACAAGQVSRDGAAWNGLGVFTYVLIQGLQGDADADRDRRVTLGELIPYVSARTAQLTRNEQVPSASGTYDTDLAIVP